MIRLPARLDIPRPTAGNTAPKLHGLDHLRAFAISYVFLFHYFILSGGQPTWLPAVASFGWTGVDLFFVLSGFLISTSLFTRLRQGREIAFGNFFARRFFRIIPAYVVVVGLYVCFPAFREKEALPPTWRFLTFTQNFGLNLKDYGTFSHAWSLCVEEHFYLVLPLVLLLFRAAGPIRRAVWLLPGLFVVGFVVRAYSFELLYAPHRDAATSWMYWYQYLYYPTYNRLDGLLIGVGIAGLYTFLPRLWSRITRYGNGLIGLGILVLIGAYYLCQDQQAFVASVFGFPVVAIGYGLVVAGAISPASYLYQWQSTLTARVATLSYSIYLTHKAVIHLTHNLLESFNLTDNLLLLVCLITSLLGAILLNRLVELPFLRLRDRLIRASM